ncbi:MAG: FkbM family methyltransferase [Thermoanaerobaculia bacterium]
MVEYSPIYEFANGIKLARKHLLEVQLNRYRAPGNPNLHEPVEETWFERLFEELPGGIGTFMDIGAALGYYSILVRRRFPNARIHAIEALEWRCREFIETFALNGLDLNGVTIHNVAIADRRREVAFLDRSFGSMIPLVRHGDRFDGETFPVPAFGLDSFAAMVDGRIDLAKMDIQGSEAAVLGSANQVLGDGRIRSWIVGTHAPDLHQLCLDFLSPHYDILHEDEHPDFQPDGIIVAVHKAIA